MKYEKKRRRKKSKDIGGKPREGLVTQPGGGCLKERTAASVILGDQVKIILNGLWDLLKW